MINNVLFDLDGTLIDTAQDLTFALNELRKQHHLPPLPLETVRPHVSKGTKTLIKIGFEIDETNPDFSKLTENFLNLYQLHLTHSSQLFKGMEQVLYFLEQQKIPWGIVTNKPHRFTEKILQGLDLHTKAACVVSGDTLSKAKPHPDTILHACEILQKDPQNSLYVGDHHNDIIASKAAGTKSLVALYGYIDKSEDPYSWQADGYINMPEEIIDWLG